MNIMQAKLIANAKIKLDQAREALEAAQKTEVEGFCPLTLRIAETDAHLFVAVTEYDALWEEAFGILNDAGIPAGFTNRNS